MHKIVAIAFIALNAFSVAAMAAPSSNSRGGAPLPIVGVGLPGLGAAAIVYFVRRHRKNAGK